VKIYCPFCGIANVPGVSTCRACGTALPVHDDSIAAPGGVDHAFVPAQHPVQAGARSATNASGQPFPQAPHQVWPTYDGNRDGVAAPGAFLGGYESSPIQAPCAPSSNGLGDPVKPIGPYNGAYPAQYRPIPPASTGNQYLAGDPRAYYQADAIAPADPYGGAYSDPFAIARTDGAGGLPACPYPLADVGTRLGAYILDVVALTVPLFVLASLATAIASPFLASTVALLFLLAPALYFVSCWANGGQTLGYRALGLRLVRTDGSQPGVGSAIARCIGLGLCLFMLVPGVLGLLWMLWDDRKQGWHDKMGDTVVVKS
jgi:uncharacterized RDD family membrane protein YckC